MTKTTIITERFIAKRRGLAAVFATIIAGSVSLQTQSEPGEHTLTREHFGPDRITQWRLPNALREISGLALTSDGRLFAHDDEHAVIYELDYAEGRIVKRFALGEKTLRRDFEGIAVVDDRFYLITSEGVLYSAAEGDDGDRVEFEARPTGLADVCEVEGLARAAQPARLLVACKKPKRKKDRQKVMIFVWDLDSMAMLEDQTFVIDLGDVLEMTGTDGFHPSGIAVNRTTGRILLIAARQRALIELDMAGNILTAFVLPLASRHPQPEGIALTVGGRIIIADEGKNKKARLAVYGAGAS